MVKDAHDKGYETTVNLMAVSTVPERELDEALALLAKSETKAIYLVDSFGALLQRADPLPRSRNTCSYCKPAGKEVGIHAHNNLQLAFANTIEAIVLGANMVDATMAGLGRGAGNCPMELLIGFLHNPKYQLRPVLRCVQNHIEPMRAKLGWGFDLPYLITGLLNQHPRTAIKFNDLRDLDRLGRQLLADYAGRDFLDGFPTLERLQAEPKGSPLARRLDAQLVRVLQDPDAGGAYFAPPGILDWETVAAFRFGGEASTIRREEASLDDYRLLRPDPTLDDLMADDLRVVDRNSMRALDRWPIYRWLVWELQDGDDAYVLSEGRWFKVSGEYLASVDSAARRVRPPTLAIPTPARVAMPEDLYNADLAAALGGVLLDKKLAQVGTERGRFELCDVFVAPDKLIHVKRGIGSQELSYLFTQGVTSAEGLRHEVKVRERFRDLVQADAPYLGAVIDASAKPAPGALEVVYVIVDAAHGRVPHDIPFFARASLARAVRDLDELDFRLSAVGVPDRP